jgi:dienelactone hydrolase
MYVLRSTRSHRNLTRGIIAGAALALALSASTSATAQTSTPPANTPVTAPKQVGAWTVIGWSQGYCAAERPVRGAAAGGAALQFVLARLRMGYRIALSAPEWDLKPQTAFPVELIADPVLRNDTKAIAVGPKLVVIELGADAQLTKKLAGAPTIEIKAAQATFKLPMEGFADALAAVETCFASLKQPTANPFAASPPATKQPDRLIKKDSDNSSNAQAPAASTKGAVDATAPVKATLNDQLVEEQTFLTVSSDKGPYRLEALVVRPAKAEGRLPIALITHGKNLTAAENQGLRAEIMRPQARDFAARGWLAVVVIRRGYGQSDGLPGVSRGAAYMSCENGDLVRGFDIEADDLDGALRAVRTRPDADDSRVIAVGQSLGGGIALAFAARRPSGLLGIVNVSGGVWRSSPNGGACDHADLVAAMGTFGSRAMVPTLWLYSENDSLFPPALVGQMREAYARSGGRADLRMFPPVVGDGHALFMDFGGRIKWLRALDGFLQANRLPNANLARVEEVMSTSKLAAGVRPVIEEYFSTPTPKLLIVSASGKGAYWVANPNDIEGARNRALTKCREKTGGECTVMMENNEIVRPLVTGAITPEVTVQ